MFTVQPGKQLPARKRISTTIEKVRTGRRVREVQKYTRNIWNSTWWRQPAWCSHWDGAELQQEAGTVPLPRDSQSETPRTPQHSNSSWIRSSISPLASYLAISSWRLSFNVNRILMTNTFSFYNINVVRYSNLGYGFCPR